MRDFHQLKAPSNWDGVGKGFWSKEGRAKQGQVKRVYVNTKYKIQIQIQNGVGKGSWSKQGQAKPCHKSIYNHKIQMRNTNTRYKYKMVLARVVGQRKSVSRAWSGQKSVCGSPTGCPSVCIPTTYHRPYIASCFKLYLIHSSNTVLCVLYWKIGEASNFWNIRNGNKSAHSQSFEAGKKTNSHYFGMAMSTFTSDIWEHNRYILPPLHVVHFFMLDVFCLMNFFSVTTSTVLNCSLWTRILSSNHFSFVRSRI